ncbi:MAG: hypothetical protein IPM31_18005 [Anaerolineae bacterium]|nr:hypothetical protein [Anaerolineae bacterium]
MSNNEKRGVFARITETLVGIGLGESFFRIGTLMLSIALIGAVIWLARGFFAQNVPAGAEALSQATEAPVIVAGIESIGGENSFGGVPRLAQVHTTIPRVRARR